MRFDRRSTLKIAASGIVAATSGVGFGLLSAGAAQATVSFPAATRGIFDLYQGKRPIGQHRYEITGSQNAPNVLTQAAFEGRALGFSARYELTTQEQWQSGLLWQLRSQGRFRSDAFQMSAQRQGDALLVTNDKDEVRPVTPNIFPTTYWMPNFVEQRAVLDTQRGDVWEINPTYLGEGSFHGTAVRGWKLDGELGLSIYYDLNNSWAGLQFRVLGSNFEYRRVG